MSTKLMKQIGVLACTFSLLVLPGLATQAQEYDGTESSTSTATTTATSTATSTNATTTPQNNATTTPQNNATSTNATSTATTTPDMDDDDDTSTSTDDDMMDEDDEGFWKGFLFESSLKAENETHDATPAVATGHSGAWFAGNGRYMNYWLSVFSEERVTGAHYHCAEEGEDGPIVVSLDNKNPNATSTATSTDGRVYGEIGRGYLSNSDIAATGMDCDDTIGYAIDSIEDLAKAIKDGLIYTNVHTTTYPAGAARAQLMPYNN